MIKRTSSASPSALGTTNPSGGGEPQGLGSEGAFYERKLEQALGSRIEALSHPSILQAVEAHFRKHPEHAHDAQAVVAAACQAKKAQVNGQKERGGVRV